MTRLGHAVLVLAFLVLAPALGVPATTESGPASRAGQLLVATPSLNDPNFVQTVVFLVTDDATGTMGIVVNRRVGESTVADLLEATGLEPEGETGSIPVYGGGPVQTEYGFLLHTQDYDDATTFKVGTRYAMTTGTTALRAIGRGEGPERFLFALGYAGWGAGQLDAEIAGGSWYLAPADDALLFGDDAAKWQAAVDARYEDL